VRSVCHQDVPVLSMAWGRVHVEVTALVQLVFPGLGVAEAAFGEVTHVISVASVVLAKVEGSAACDDPGSPSAGMQMMQKGKRSACLSGVRVGLTQSLLSSP